MTTKQFINKLNRTITIEGQNLIIEFFITFSRFECALKISGFVNGDNERVTANWETFVASIANHFTPAKSEKLKKAVESLMQYPPRIQMIENKKLGWRDRTFQKNQPIINKLCLSIKDIRNNLFHGGKFNGNYQQDASRNYVLLKSALIILNDWLEINQTVKQNFLVLI